MPEPTSKKERLARSDEMTPVAGSVDVDVPVDILWREFDRPNFWPRWNKSFFWCRNRKLREGQQLVWCFEPIKRWMLYKFPAIARIDEVHEAGPLRSVTWEVVAFPGLYARHTYSIEDLGDGKSRFSSWEKAYGWSFRLMRWFWIAHFTFVKRRSLEGAAALEKAYKTYGELDASKLPRRSYLLFWSIVLLTIAALVAAIWFYVSFIRLSAHELVSGVHFVEGGGGNSLVVESEGELLLVDPKFPPGSSALRRWIDGNTSGAVDVIVNTHYHYDHTQGNTLYPGARILAHANTHALMLERDGQWWRDGRTGFLPTAGVDRPTTLHVGDIEVRIEPVAAAHTNGDLVVILPAQDIVATGDLVFNRYYPFFDLGRGGANIDGLIDAVRSLSDRYPTAIFVPGHGPAANAEDLRNYSMFLASVRTSAAEAKARGEDVGSLLDRLDTGRWERSILPSFHNNRLHWATRSSTIRSIYALTDQKSQ
ncbi:MBL fold metallo-hydrolase [Sinorhizobium meliloti]|uniref:MBL fold metallo-hydrolase n=1 Tax=Rhizobium meliloti TaxID=382 RepID=UPI003D657EEB